MPGIPKVQVIRAYPLKIAVDRIAGTASIAFELESNDRLHVVVPVAGLAVLSRHIQQAMVHAP